MSTPAGRGASGLPRPPVPGAVWSAIPLCDWLLWRPSYSGLAADLLSDPARPKSGRSHRVFHDRLVSSRRGPCSAGRNPHASPRLDGARRLQAGDGRGSGARRPRLRWAAGGHELGISLLLRHEPVGGFAGGLLTRSRWETVRRWAGSRTSALGQPAALTPRVRLERCGQLN